MVVAGGGGWMGCVGLHLKLLGSPLGCWYVHIAERCEAQCVSTKLLEAHVHGARLCARARK